jgi:hypothetical protein
VLDVAGCAEVVYTALAGALVHAAHSASLPSISVAVPATHALAMYSPVGHEVRQGAVFTSVLPYWLNRLPHVLVTYVPAGTLEHWHCTVSAPADLHLVVTGASQ